MKMEISELLRLMAKKDASDLHLTCGVSPVLRIDGKLTVLAEFDKLMPPESERLIYNMLTEEQRKRFEQDGELDFSFGISKLGRFRVNVHRQRGSVAASIRRLVTRIQSVEELNLPAVARDLALLPRGLVLVTGPAGCGKSTTLAAMIDTINTEKLSHIITIEDPIEYLYANKRSVIQQREVSSDTRSFASALKRVVRQDPDVIMVGEMRDLETVSASITAAETGHLVLATLHTIEAVQTVDRIIDIFPSGQQEQVRVQASLALQAVVSQQLFPRIDKPGRVPVVEVMVVTPAIRNLIREAKTHQIYSHIEMGAKFGMQSMDQSLYELCKQGIISQEDGLAKARDPESLKRKLSKLEVTGAGVQEIGDQMKPGPSPLCNTSRAKEA